MSIVDHLFGEGFYRSMTGQDPEPEWSPMQELISLKPVGTSPSSMLQLYRLLRERTPEQSISHREMPSLFNHFKFVMSKPYQEWHWIMAGNTRVGTIYLTKNREIGISIFKEHQRKRYGTWAVMLLMQFKEGEFFANINPANEASAAMFKNLGFKLIQHTYRLDGK